MVLEGSAVDGCCGFGLAAVLFEEGRFGLHLGGIGWEVPYGDCEKSDMFKISFELIDSFIYLKTVITSSINQLILYQCKS